MLNFEAVQSEKGLRAQIEKCLKKQHHGATNQKSTSYTKF